MTRRAAAATAGATRAIAARSAAFVVAFATAIGVAPARALDVEAGLSYEHLTGPADDWRERWLLVDLTRPRQHGLYAAVRETRRFGLDDHAFEAGGALPLGARTVLSVDASGSPTHRVLARWSAGALAQVTVADGWVAGVGLRRSAYALADADVATVGLERYLGDWRLAADAFVGRTRDSDAAVSYRLQVERWYGDRDRVRLSLAAGEEVEYLGPTFGARVTDVRAVSLSGQHDLAERWTLVWELSTVEQGSLYRRSGGRAGVRYRF